MRSTSSSKPVSTNPLSGDRSADEVARRTITAHQDIALAVTGKTATYLGRASPDDLGIMTHILPATRRAHIREGPGYEKAFFVNPSVDHILKRKGACRSRPEILPLIGPRRIGAMFKPPVGDQCFCIVQGRRVKRSIKFDRWNANFGACGVVRSQHDVQHRAARW